MDPERDDEPQDDPLTAGELSADLMDILFDANCILTRERAVVDFRQFGHDGIRHNDGFTVCLSDGTEYQVTIVRSN